MTILPGEPNYGIIEELRSVVNDEVVIEVWAYVRHGIDVPVLVGDIVAERVEPRVNPLLHQDLRIRGQIVLWVQIHYDDSISAHAKRGGKV